MAEEKTQALLFEHELGSTKSDDEKTDRAKLKEYFIPYTVETLFRNDLLSDTEKKLLYGWSDNGEIPQSNGDIKINRDYNPSGDWGNEGGVYQETSLFDYVSDATYGIESVRKTSDDTHRVRVGVLTELVKILFLQFKVDFSILYRMLSNKKLESSDNETIVKVLHGIAQRSLDEKKKKDFTSRRIREQIETGKEQVAINNLISAIHETAKARLEYVYILNTTDEILEIVIKAVNNSSRCIRKKYEDDKGCFCVVLNEDKNYFSFSGDDAMWRNDKLYDVSEKVKNEFDIVLEKTAERCRITCETLCYGLLVEHEFLRFPKPLPYKQYIQRFCFYNKYCQVPFIYLLEADAGKLYGCCERKIFVNTNNQKPLEIHCRWAPCEKCMPAVYKEFMEHSSFKFIALAKNFNELKEKLKNDNNIDNIQPWKLEKYS